MSITFALFDNVNDVETGNSATADDTMTITVMARLHFFISMTLHYLNETMVPTGIISALAFIVRNRRSIVSGRMGESEHGGA